MNWIDKLEALLGELLAHFRSHPAIAAASAPADPPADFGPVPPDGTAVPPGKPLEPPAPPAPQAETPRPPNTTDAAAPGFVPPAQSAAPAPVDIPVPAANDRPDPGQFIDFKEWGPGSTFDMIGKAPRVLQNVTQDLRVCTNIRPSTKYPYTLTVNGVSVTRETDAVAEVPVRGVSTINISVDQPDDARVVMVYYPLV